MVDGVLWGHIAAFGEAGEVLPPGCETRLADFSQLMATAIARRQYERMIDPVRQADIPGQKVAGQTISGSRTC